MKIVDKDFISPMITIPFFLMLVGFDLPSLPIQHQLHQAIKAEK